MKADAAIRKPTAETDSTLSGWRAFALALLPTAGAAVFIAATLIIRSRIDAGGSHQLSLVLPVVSNFGVIVSGVGCVLSLVKVRGTPALVAVIPNATSFLVLLSLSVHA